MEFRHLIEMDLQEGRTDAIRRAFAPFSELVNVSGLEEQAAIVLVNLSLKRAEAQDLLDRQLAIKTLRDKKHLSACLSEMRWLHTHNLKYPDPRVSGQRLIAQLKHGVSGCVSSATLPTRMGWSHNSSAVNKAKLFGTSFRWEGRRLNLAALLSEKSGVWKQVLRGLGVQAKVLREWEERLGILMSETTVPDEVSVMSPQVRFPYRNGYLAITPVVSTALQCEIQRLRRERVGHYSTVTHAHPASVGDLTASLGGNVAILNYPPPVWNSTRHTIFQSRVDRARSGDGVLDEGAIYSQGFLQALERIITINRLPTFRQRRSVKVAALRTVRQILADWLAPIVEYKEARNQRGAGAEENSETLDERLLLADCSALPRFHKELNQRLHLQLQAHRRASKYAYHTELLEPFSSQLAAVLRSLGKEQIASAIEKPGTEFIHLESLRVFDAQALANPYLAGIPSLTALWGLVHKYEQTIKRLLGKEILLSGVSWFVRSYSASNGKRLPEPSVLKRGGESVSRPGITDSKLCDLVMDLVVRVYAPNGSMLSDEDSTALKAALPSSFAGGVLHPPSLYENKDWLKVYSNLSTVFRQLALLSRNGRWIIPEVADCSSLESLLEKCDQMPCIKPAMLGYGFLETPGHRQGGIERQHVFSEPLTGLVRCPSPIEVRMRGADYFYNNAFWGMEVGEHAMLMKKA